MRRWLGLIFAIMLFTVGACAQTFRGAINGTVADPSGAMVSGASVKATNNATGVTLTTVTTSDGQFSFQDLPLGSYKVSVSASGFGSVNTDNVTVAAGNVYTLPVTLKVGSSTTAVEVSAAALTVDTTTATQSMSIPNEVVQDVPLNGRDFTQLISVAPGYGGYSVGGFGSLNGTRANQMNWQIDGVDNNDFWHNIPAVNQGGVSGIAGIIMPIDATDEFSAQTQSGAEAGRNPGGTVNLVLKSGTNQIHGSAYYFNRNEFYGAASPFFTKSDTVKRAPPLRNQNYGFSIGGPIIKDKTFYFVTFEKQQYIIGLSGLATEPSTGWVTNAYNLMASDGVTTISPTSCQLLGPLTSALPAGNNCTNAGLWPTSGAGSIANLDPTTSNFFSPVASTGYSYNGVAKIDHNFNDKHHLSVRWFGGQGSQTAPLGGSPALGTASSNLAFYFEKAPIHVYNYAAVLNSVLTPRMTNQLLFGVNYFNQTFSDANASFDTRALGLFLSPDATIHGQPILGAPNVAISGFEQIGLTPPEGRNDVTGMLTDVVSYNTGRHQLRFGGEIRQGRVNEFYHRRGTGKFAFTGAYGFTDVNNNFVGLNPWANTCASGDPTCALADFLDGDVTTSSIAVGNPERFVRVNGYNLFFQDSVQVTRKLNVNFGLRYEYFGPLHSDKKDLAVFIPGKGMLIQGAGIDSIFPPDKNNFAPRFGFAYQPTAKGDLVVRGGVGVFFDQINMNPFLDYRPPISGADGLEDNPIGPNAVSNYSLDLYNWDTQQANSPTGSIFPGVTLCPSLDASIDPSCGNNIYNVYSVNQNFRAPYFFNYNLQIEKSLGNSAVIQIGYVGSEGRKLSTTINANQDPNNLDNVSGRLNSQYPNLGSVIQMNSIASSNYNSLQAVARIRAWHGLTSQFAYTWAHALDNMSEYRGVVPLDSYNMAAEYGNGDFDTRHNFTATFTYAIPGSSHGPKILTHGWQVNSLWSFHTGQPFNINGGFSRPGCDLVSDPFAGVSHKFSKADGGEQWVDPAAFNCNDPAALVNPRSSFLGTLSRNKFYAPGYGSVDLSVFKNIPVYERVKIQLRAEMFNVFNRINLASGGGSVSQGSGFVSDTIGDFNGAPGIGPGEAFNMQLGLKILF